MKYWKYEIQTIATVGKDEQGNHIAHESFLTKLIPCTPENEEIAKQEAYNGEYTVEEVEEPVAAVTLEERTAALEEALTLLLEGATE